MGVPLEDRLFIPRDLYERVEDARGPRMEAEDLPDRAPILEVEPTGDLESRDQPPGSRAEQRRFVDHLDIGIAIVSCGVTIGAAVRVNAAVVLTEREQHAPGVRSRAATRGP